MTAKTTVEQTVAMLRERGKPALDLARQTMKKEKISYKPLQEAVYYFVNEFFKEVMQPGLLSLYCEAVGGDPKDTTKVGAAMVLLVGAADLHDDMIDNSTIKGGTLTVLGKFGKDITILAGDAFLIKGLFLLNETTGQLPEPKRTMVLKNIERAFFDLSSTEAEEATYSEKKVLTPQQYLDLLKRKTAVSEATAKIGAILGNGSAKEIEALGKIGRSMSLLNSIRDEFIDIYELEELKNRISRGVPPLPILFAFQDPKKKTAIKQLLEGKLTKERVEKIVNIVMKAKETEDLRHLMQSRVRESEEQLANLKCCRETIKLLLESALEDLV